jgi:hypothetical protein
LPREETNLVEVSYPSRIVVRGLREPYPALTNFPEIALRVAPCVDPPPTRSFTVVRGLRFACVFVTKRPEMVLLARVPLPFLGMMIPLIARMTLCC